MKTLRFPLLLALAATSLFAACDQDKDALKPKTPTDLLVGKDWKMTARTVSPARRLDDGRVVTDMYAVTPSYDQDDLLRFEKPNVFTYDEGPTKFDDSKPQRYTGTWGLTEQDKVLSTTATGLGSGSYDVLEVTETILKVSGVRTETDGNRYTYTITYTRQ